MQLARDYWDLVLAADPVNATAIGERSFDHRLRDISPEALDKLAGAYRAILDQAERLDPDALTQAGRITLTCLRFQLRSDLARLASGLHTWTVDPLGGPQVGLMNIPAIQTLTGPESGRAMVARWQAMGPYLDQHVANLRRGLAEGKVAGRDAVLRVVGQIDEAEAKPVEDWALLAPLRAIPESWPEADRRAFAEGLRAAVTDEVRPALLRYRDFLKAEILPQARDQAKAGILHTPGGEAAYRDLVLVHTSLDYPPEDIHRIGLEEVERINDETRALGTKVLGTGDLEEIHRRLRGDPALHFKTRDEVAEKAEEALRRAEAAVPGWFGIRHRAPCRVLRMEPHEEKHSTIAYYLQPSVDGSRPGSYYINTYAPETRPRYEAEALAFHEAVPGHHLQIAVMQEVEGLPEFRKHEGVTAYIEGWALYTERLADEMGLYSGDLDRMGMLSFDSWRACRLVVDTGLHVLGWSRQQAIDFMLANSSLAENNIVNEVDRYITWPGQALAYKLGQREIFRLRGRAESALGPRFDIKAFHDIVLSPGAVDLGTLREIVGGWMGEDEGNG